MRKAVTTVLLALAIGALPSLWFARELSQERERSKYLRGQLTQLQRSQSQLPAATDAVSLPSQSRFAGAEVSATPGRADPAAKERTNAQNYDDDYDAFRRRAVRNPKFREALRKQQRLELAANYVDLAAVLGVSQETANQLIDWLVERGLRDEEKSLPNPRTEEERLLRQAENKKRERERDRELEAMLGADKLARWKNYEASLNTRHQVHQLEVALATTNEPLRDDQLEPLINTVFAERKQLREELAEFSATLDWPEGAGPQSMQRRNEKSAERSAAANQRIHTAASAILSPQQLASLDQMLERQLAWQVAEFGVENATSELYAPDSQDAAN